MSQPSNEAGDVDSEGDLLVLTDEQSDSLPSLESIVAVTALYDHLPESIQTAVENTDETKATVAEDILEYETVDQRRYMSVPGLSNGYTPGNMSLYHGLNEELRATVDGAVDELSAFGINTTTDLATVSKDETRIPDQIRGTIPTDLLIGTAGNAIVRHTRPPTENADEQVTAVSETIPLGLFLDTDRVTDGQTKSEQVASENDTDPKTGERSADNSDQIPQHRDSTETDTATAKTTTQPTSDTTDTQADTQADQPTGRDTEQREAGVQQDPLSQEDTGISDDGDSINTEKQPDKSERDAHDGPVTDADTQPDKRVSETDRERQSGAERSSGIIQTITSAIPFAGGSDTTTTTQSADTLNDTDEIQKNIVAPEKSDIHSRYIETDHQYIKSFYVSGYPSSDRINTTSLLLETAIRATQLNIEISIHYDPRSRESAEQKLDKEFADAAAEQMDNKGDPLAQQEPKEAQREAEILRQAVVQDGRRMYDVGVYFTVRSDIDLADPDAQLEKLDDDSKKFVSLMNQYEDIEVSQKVGQQLQTLQTVSPIAKDISNEKTLMIGDAGATLFPYFSPQYIEQDGIMMGISKKNHSPILVDPFSRNKGHNVLRVGDIGSGKSFASKLFVLRLAMHYSDIEFYIIDPMGDSLGVCEALDGDWIQVGGQDTINPLKIEQTPEHVLREEQIDPWKQKINDAVYFIKRLFEMRDINYSSDHMAVYRRALKNAYNSRGIGPNPETHSRESPTMDDVLSAVKDIENAPGEYIPDITTDESITNYRQWASELMAKLTPLKQGGQFANFNGRTDISITDSDMTYIDLSNVGARSGGESIMMQLLFSNIYQEVKNNEKKSVVVIDEAHKIFREDDNVDFFEEVVRHSRHYNLSLQFLSQSLEEFFVNETTRVIADQCSMRFIHRLSGINQQLAHDVIGLNGKQIEYVRNEAERGESDEPYSGVLMDIGGMGTFRGKIYATQDEAAIIDYEDMDDDDAKAFRSKRIKYALDRRIRSRYNIDPRPFEFADRVEQHIDEEKQNMGPRDTPSGIADGGETDE